MIYPFTTVILAQILAYKIHRPVTSLLLPIFFVSQMVGSILVDNGFTRHGLRLKHVSVFPMGPTEFVSVKFISFFIPVVVANLAVTTVLGYWWKAPAFQLAQGAIYSLFHPLILIVTVNTMAMEFNSLYRHEIISVLIVILIEIIASIVYLLLMSFSFIVGLAFVVSLFALTYFRWMEAWGKRLSLEFQTLLDESK